MNAFWMVLAIGSILLTVGMLIAIHRMASSIRNDIEVERLKSNVPIYPWHDAPDWAVCAATDSDGEAYWFTVSRIFPDEDIWKSVIPLENGRCRKLSNFTLPAHINWKDSKEVRP